MKGFGSSAQLVEAVTAGYRPVLPTAFPPRLRSLMNACWVSTAKQRPTMVRLLAWLKDGQLLQPPEGHICSTHGGATSTVSKPPADSATTESGSLVVGETAVDVRGDRISASRTA